jgi:cell division protein ZapA (FtsZ GTPase activity inhibitor)
MKIPRGNKYTVVLPAVDREGMKEVALVIDHSLYEFEKMSNQIQNHQKTPTMRKV